MGNNSKIVSAIDDAMDAVAVGGHPCLCSAGQKIPGTDKIGGEVRGIMLHTNPTGKDELMAIGGGREEVVVAAALTE